MKRSILAALLLICACKKSSIFTEIDASFKSLDDVFVEEFKSSKKQIEKNTELTLDADTAKTGRYDTKLTLDVWEFNSDDDAKKSYETLAAIEKQNQPKSYDQTKSGEYRLRYTRQTGVAGEIFTVKKILFRFLAEDQDTIREYLIASKLGRVR